MLPKHNTGWMVLPVLFLAGSAIGAGIYHSGGLENAMRVWAKESYLRALTCSVENSVLAAPTTSFIERLDLEARLQKMKVSKPSGAYYVLYGPKAAGKSSLVANFVQNRKGVVNVMVCNSSEKATVADICAEIMANLSFNVLGILPPPRIHTHDLIDAVLKSTFEDDSLPLVIFEVEGFHPRVIAAVNGVCELLGKYCTRNLAYAGLC